MPLNYLLIQDGYVDARLYTSLRTRRTTTRHTNGSTSQGFMMAFAASAVYVRKIGYTVLFSLPRLGYSG